MLQPVSPDHYYETNAEYHEPYDCLDPPTYVEVCNFRFPLYFSNLSIIRWVEL